MEERGSIRGERKKLNGGVEIIESEQGKTADESEWRIQEVVKW